MSRLLATSLVLVGVLGPVARAADEPRTLIEKAVAAQGGLDRLGREVAVVKRVQGSLFGTLGGTAFTCTFIHQAGGQSKMTLQIEAGGNRLTLVHALDGDRGWKDSSGVAEDLSEVEIKHLKRSAHIDRVTSLVPLLKEDGFRLEPLGESQVEGKPVRGVKVTAEGRPDVSLFFSAETGLLVKFTFLDLDPATGKEAPHETVLGDYREPDLGRSGEETLKSVRVAVDGPGRLEVRRHGRPTQAHEQRV